MVARRRVPVSEALISHGGFNGRRATEAGWGGVLVAWAAHLDNLRNARSTRRRGLLAAGIARASHKNAVLEEFAAKGGPPALNLNEGRADLWARVGRKFAQADGYVEEAPHVDEVGVAVFVVPELPDPPNEEELRDWLISPDDLADLSGYYADYYPVLADSDDNEPDGDKYYPGISMYLFFQRNPRPS